MTLFFITTFLDLYGLFLIITFSSLTTLLHMSLSPFQDYDVQDGSEKVPYVATYGTFSDPSCSFRTMLLPLCVALFFSSIGYHLSQSPCPLHKLPLPYRFQNYTVPIMTVTFSTKYGTFSQSPLKLYMIYLQSLFQLITVLVIFLNLLFTSD